MQSAGESSTRTGDPFGWTRRKAELERDIVVQVRSRKGLGDEVLQDC